MIILGIDTSCDDTSLALIDRDRRILAHIISSQADLHGLFGGVVPEIASRKHVELIDGIYNDVLEKAGISAGDIDLVGVTSGPGLIGSVLVGLSFAKGLCLAGNIPLIGVNHVEAHAMSIFLEREAEFPFVALVVSGGHTIILAFDAPCSFKVIGSTLDDAAGEAFDKIAKFLGLGYPGGRIIEEMARTGSPDHVAFPRPMMDDAGCNFSFSGLKTAVLRVVRQFESEHKPLPVADLAASFQAAVVDVLLTKTLLAARKFGARQILVAGGVSANAALREALRAETDFPVHIPPLSLCTDNAAMIAAAGYFRFALGQRDPLNLDVQPTWPLS